jgi:5'-3' exonuclease
MTDTAMFVDVRNAMYRAVYAQKQNLAKRKSAYHGVYYLLRFIVEWTEVIKPTSIHIFWDAPRSEVWRRKLYSEYKARPNSYYMDISKDLAEISVVAEELFQYLNFRQYSRKAMEADDLIYAAAAVRHPGRNVIVSTDSDLTQIPFYFNSCVIYNPQEKVFAETPARNPALEKAVIGDKSDNIKGYQGIGPKKGGVILESYGRLSEFCAERGWDSLRLNLLLTDLSLNPKLYNNKVYAMKVLGQDVAFDKSQIIEVIRKHKITGIETNFSELIYPFQSLV